MARSTHVCAGCGATLAARRDLTPEHGTVHTAWCCVHCRTRVPGIVAEKLRTQTQH